MTEEKPFFQQRDDVNELVTRANEQVPVEPEIIVIEQPPLPREGVPPTERTRINLARENRRIT